MKKLLCIICLVCVLCAGCRNKASRSDSSSPSTDVSDTHVTLSQETLELCFTPNSTETNCLPHEFKVVLALTKEQQARGLMFVKDSELSEHQGMLFVFPDERPRAFWMHNTYVSLDIIYIDANKNVVSLVEDAPTLSDTPLPSIFPAKYVVEIRGGLAKKIGITIGSKAVFD